ncbi:hypothetical protein HUT16_34900 [Kitasatospora sp. NA04385]|uniref:hypothetical protein n=1 Tax=Kitasatospora sp. NA04385 TaxID=2742135 RepID=UPI001590BFF1|nr:hypothetical protein [Kitasatospora sp. NA04385]QKW23595.1 hypothetical protein HUT16_34900 [Kitasatospora sp. NA04385]
MSLTTWSHEGDLYCSLFTETGVDGNRIGHFELSEARLVPSGTPSVPDSPAPGPTAVTVVVQDLREALPTAFFSDGHTVPFAVLQRFVAMVAARLEGAAG